MTLQSAFRLLDEYNQLLDKDDETSDARTEEIVTKLYNAGYVIRPAQMMIIKDEVNFEHVNPGSNELTLHGRETRMPVERPVAAKKAKKNVSPL